MLLDFSITDRVAAPKTCGSRIVSRAPAASAGANVAILLCTMQGRKYLPDQLDSIRGQTHALWSIWASDVGSTVGTRDILGEYQAKLGATRLCFRDGPAKGYAANFLSLVCDARVTADYYAYADQDDIWESNKLELALEWLQTIPSHVPALYCTRTRSVDVNNHEIGLSPLFAKPPSFANALIQSLAGGNTMVFNDAARNLLCGAGPDVPAVSHDWWTYMVVAGCGGQVLYDPVPSVRYRQHESNLVGTNNDWRARLVRVRMLLQGRFRDWNDKNMLALECIRGRLTPENRGLLDKFSKARNRRLVSRLVGLRRCGIYRQTLLGNLGLIAATFLKKL